MAHIPSPLENIAEVPARSRLSSSSSGDSGATRPSTPVPRRVWVSPDPTTQLHPLLAVLPRPVKSGVDWPSESKQAQRKSEWLSEYVDDCPTANLFGSPSNQPAPLSAANPVEDFVFRQGKLVEEIHAYFTGLEWQAHRGRDDARGSRRHPASGGVSLSSAPSPAPQLLELSGHFAALAPSASDEDLPATLSGDGEEPHAHPEELLVAVMRCAQHHVLSDMSTAPSKALVSYAQRIIRAVNEDLQAGVSPFTHEAILAKTQELNRSRSDKEMLVLELQRQLRVLQVNSHVFCSPKAFNSIEEYGQWREAELAHIKSLVGRVWGSDTMPESLFDDYTGVHNHHSQFRELLRLSLRADAYGNRTIVDSPMFSDQARHLLDEYGLQFGVGRQFQCIATISLLAEVFVHSLPCYQRTLQQVNAFLELVPASEASFVATRCETTLMREAATTLHSKAKHAVWHMHTIFPNNSPAGALDTLLELLAALLEVDRRIDSGQAHMSRFDVLLERYITGTLTEQYTRMLEKGQATAAAKSAPGPKQLNALVRAVTAKVDVFKKYFQKSFRPYLDLVGLAARCLYDRLCSDIRTFCLDFSGRQAGLESIDPDTIMLGFALNALDRKWQRLLPSTACERWKTDFTCVILHWIDVVHCQIHTWCRRSFAQEELSPVTVLVNDETGSGSARLVPLSSSCIDALYAISKGVSFFHFVSVLILPTAGLPSAESCLSADADAESVFSEQDATQDSNERLATCRCHFLTTVGTILHDYVAMHASVDVVQLPESVQASVRTQFQADVVTAFRAVPRQMNLDGTPARAADAAGAEPEDDCVVLDDAAAVPIPWSSTITTVIGPAAHFYNHSAGESDDGTPGQTVALSIRSLSRRNYHDRASMASSLPVSYSAQWAAVSRSIDGGASSRAHSTSSSQDRPPSSLGVSASQRGGSLSNLSSPRSIPSTPASHAARSFDGGFDSTPSTTGGAPASRRRRSNLASLAPAAASTSAASTKAKQARGQGWSDTAMRLNVVLCLGQILEDLARTTNETQATGSPKRPTDPTLMVATVLARSVVTRTKSAPQPDEVLVDVMLPGARVYMQQAAHCFADMLCYRLNEALKPAMARCLPLVWDARPDPSAHREVYSLLDSKLHDLSKRLLPEAFQIVLKMVWESVLKNFEGLTFEAPGVPHSMSRACAEYRNKVLLGLIDYFDCPERGNPHAPADALELSTLLSLFALSSPDLILFYHLLTRSILLERGGYAVGFSSRTRTTGDGTSDTEDEDYGIFRSNSDASINARPRSGSRDTDSVVTLTPERGMADPTQRVLGAGRDRSGSGPRPVTLGGYKSVSPSMSRAAGSRMREDGPQRPATEAAEAEARALPPERPLSPDPDLVELEAEYPILHLHPVQLNRQRLVQCLKQAAKSHLQSQFLLQSSDEQEERELGGILRNYVASGLVFLSDCLHRFTQAANLLRDRGFLWADEQCVPGRDLVQWLLEHGNPRPKEQAQWFGGGNVKVLNVLRQPKEPLGLMLTKCEVRSVRPDGVAYRSGVREGDLLTRINGQSTTHETHEAIVKLLSQELLQLTLEERLVEHEAVAETLSPEEATSIGSVLVEYGHLTTGKERRPFQNSDRRFRFTADFENTADDFDSTLTLGEWDVSDIGLVLGQIAVVLGRRESDMRVKRVNTILFNRSSAPPSPS